MQDPELDSLILKRPKLILKRRATEYRLFRPKDEGRGSLWICRQRIGYRVVTKGAAHCVDDDLERLTGMKAREMSDRGHKWWKGVHLTTLDRVFSAYED